MLSENLERTLKRAGDVALSCRHEFVTLEHLLAAMCDDEDVQELFIALQTDTGALTDELSDFIRNDLSCLVAKKRTTPKPTLAFGRVLQRAVNQCQSSGRAVVTSLHLIVSMYSERDSFAVSFLENQGVTKLDVMSFLSRGSSKTGKRRPTGVDEDGDTVKEGEEALKAYCVDLNELARKGKIDALIGRDRELERTILILRRRTKNNPLFVGESGVGKTALAQGLALRIVQGKVPDFLKNAVILRLDLGALLAGTRYRGDFEERLKEILKQIENNPDIILFIDEIHTVLGAGATSGGTMDASNLLKPALSDGSIRCIGSTTYKEFRNHLEKDAAFLRRFGKIDVEEPDVETTERILEGLKPAYEKHHGVKYTADAVKTAAKLAARRMNDRRLPDKAIDLMDEAGAAKALKSARRGNKRVTAADICDTLARMAQIPSQTLKSNDKAALMSLEKDLKSAVFGQNKALEALAGAVKLSRAGLRDPVKPVGSYLFSGPTGVGKTEAAKQLAKTLGVDLIRFDMSEYMEKHSVARLIGTPPGYVGFDQGGLLTDAVDTHPYCVLLLDEIEKAHPDLFNILLQVMDYGKLTDSKGKKIDFSNVILIMTTNAGAAAMAKQAMGFTNDVRTGEDKEAIERLFTPEFRNRLDAVIAFDRLDNETVRRVVNKFLAQTQERLNASHVVLETAFSAKEWIVRKGYDSQNGARPIMRLIQEYIHKPLADEILFGRLTHGGKAKVTVKNDRLIVSCTPDAPRKKQEREEEPALF